MIFIINFVLYNFNEIKYPICIDTSGSTGKPKGCLISHRNVLSNHEGWKKFFLISK